MGLTVLPGALQARAGRLRPLAADLAAVRRPAQRRAEVDRGRARRLRLMPNSRRGALWRAVFAAVIVIGATAATTAVAGLLQFKNLVADISVGQAIPHAAVTLPSPGDPQTLLIIGSDHRAGTPFNSANTDTMLLVRLNGSSSTINLISVPRDLQVQI